MNICSQCGKEFETWIKLPPAEWAEWLTSEPESDFCSDECENEWREDNREELCN